MATNLTAPTPETVRTAHPELGGRLLTDAEAAALIQQIDAASAGDPVLWQAMAAQGGTAGGGYGSSFGAPIAPGPSAAAAAPASGGGLDFSLPGYEDVLGQTKDRAAAVLGRTMDADTIGRQRALADQLQRYSTGQESVSQLQLRQAADANIAQQMAMAAGARPGQGQLAALTAAQQAGSIGTALAGQQAIAGLQERQQAASALGQQLGAMQSASLQFGQQQDTAYQQALAQRLAAAELQQRGAQNRANYLLQVEAMKKGDPSFLRGATDLAAGAASIAGGKKSGGSADAGYDSAADAAKDLTGGADYDFSDDTESSANTYA